jgi:DNA-binding NarL/FixJ family response regulator
MATILLATDADWVRDEVVAALEGSHQLLGVRAGREVFGAVKRTGAELVILDMQIGSMGGMATCMHLRNEHSGGRIQRVNVLMLLDRPADTFLAQRCDADGWLIKPLDALRIRRATTLILGGAGYIEGAPVDVEDLSDTSNGWSRDRARGLAWPGYIRDVAQLG